MEFAEIRNRFAIRKLSASERISRFNCGDSDLNDFIMNEAADYRKALLAVTYVFEERSTKQVAAFFSLANDKVSLSEFGNKTEFNRFRRMKFVNKIVPLTDEDKTEDTRLLYFDLNDVV